MTCKRAKRDEGEPLTLPWLYAQCEHSNGCVLWKRAATRFGYGHAWDVARQKMVATHRAAYALHHGIELEDFADRCVLHSCDTPACINPEHLSLGDRAENARHRVERGRSLTGERNVLAKLTAGQVMEIREAAAAGASYRELAERYGVAHAHISGIATGRFWQHTGGPRTHRGTPGRKAQMRPLSHGGPTGGRTVSP